MLFLVGNVGEPIGYVFCVFPLVEFCLRPSSPPWTLKDSNTNYKIDWSILATAPAYSNKRKRCHLCLTEKLYLIKAKKPTLLNKRTELISKCRHENKFYLANFELNCQQ